MIYMAINIIELRAGGKVICPLCDKGFMQTVNNVAPEKATRFICSNCGEKLIINLCKSKPSK